MAISNHRHELLIVDLETGLLTLVDRSPVRRIGGFDWSPDGRWLAYSYGLTRQTTALRLYQLAETTDGDGDGDADTATDSSTEAAVPETGAASAGRIITITRPVLHDLGSLL